MSDRDAGDGRAGRPSQRAALLTETVIVAGACLLALFWIIPAETMDQAQLGLSPRMMPMSCIAVILVLTLGRCALDMVFTSQAKRETPRQPLRYALLVMVAAACGLTAIHQFGLLAGSVLLSLFVVLAIGERRPLRILAVALAGGAVPMLIRTLGL